MESEPQGKQGQQRKHAEWMRPGGELGVCIVCPLSVAASPSLSLSSFAKRLLLNIPISPCCLVSLCLSLATSIRQICFSDEVASSVRLMVASPLGRFCHLFIAICALPSDCPAPAPSPLEPESPVTPMTKCAGKVRAGLGGRVVALRKGGAMVPARAHSRGGALRRRVVRRRR